MPSTPRTPAPERPAPPVPVSVPAPAPPPPLETPRSPSLGEEYHTPPPSLDASPREQTSFPSDGRGGGTPTPTRSPSFEASPREEAILPADGKGWAPPNNPSRDVSPREQAILTSDGRGGGGAPAKSPPRDASPREQASLPRDGRGGGGAAPAKSPPLSPVRLPTPHLLPPPASPSAKNGQEGGAAGAAAPARPQLRLMTGLVRTPSQGSLDHRQQQQRQQHAASAAAENGGAVPPDVAAVAAVGERRVLSVTLRVATAALSLAAFSVIASARTSGWAGDSYARHQQYRYAVAVNVIVCAYSIAQSFGEIRRLISPTFIFRSRPSYYCSLFLDQVLAYLLMSASSAAASRNDLWVSRFGTDAFNRKITSALWLSFIGFLMLALNALISTANLFSMV